jgi:tetratricopeptide (TPR) repeat protein
VRCTSCGHVFKVFPPSAGGVQETWVLKQVSGATFPFDRLGVLQDWIAEGKVSVNDQISKSGGEWKRLGDIAEMKPFFDGARPSVPTQTNEASAPAAGHPRHEVSDHADTIRVSAPGAPGTPAAASAPPAKPHSTAQFASPVPPAQRAPAVAPSVPPGVSSDAPTIRASTPASIPTSHAPTQPAPAPPGISDAPTIRASAAAPVPPPAAPQQPPVAPPEAPTINAPAAAPPAAEAPTMAAPTAPQQPPAPEPAPPQREPDLSQVPATEEEGEWESGESVPTEGPAWAERDSDPGAIDDDFDEDMPAQPRKVGRWIALFVVLALVAAAFYVFMYQREAARELLAGIFSSADDERHHAFYLKGRESFLLDTDPAFKQADREFQKVLALKEDHAPTLAALGEMYASWAQYTLDAEIDARIDAKASAAEGTSPDFREAERLHREFEDRLAEATRWSKQALEVDPALPEAHLAMADLKRLSGELDAAREHLGKARSETTGAAPDYVQALLSIDEAKDTTAVDTQLREVIAAEPLLRAIYRQARLFAAAGDAPQAEQALTKLFELNSDHARARALEARLEAGQTVALRASDVDSAALAAETGQPDAGPEPGEDPEAEVATPAAGAGGSGPRAGAGGEAPIAAGGSVDSMLQRAARAQEAGRVGEASGLFKQVLDRQPGNIDALSGMAYCYLDRGAKGQAISHFRRALGVNGRYGPALIGLAGVYKSQGQKAQALKYYKQYLSAHPSGRYATMAKVNAMQLEQALEASGEQDTGGGTAETPPPKDEGGEAPAPTPPTEDKPAGESPKVESSPYGGDKPSDPPASGGGGEAAPSAPAPPPAADPPADPAPPAPPAGT